MGRTSLRSRRTPAIVVLVLDDVVQQAGDRLVGVAEVLDHHARHGQQVTDIGHPRSVIARGTFAELRRVRFRGVLNGVGEPRRVDYRC